MYFEMFSIPEIWPFSSSSKQRVVALTNMIKGIFIINNHGQSRLVKFYEPVPDDIQAQVTRECYALISKRSDTVCNFLDGGK